MIKKSPYNLLQEIYFPDQWKMMVCCMFLNQTSRKQVDVIRDEFFKRWPNAKKASKANQEEMSELIKSLGFRNRRSSSIIKMSKEFSENKWENPIELHGLGKYAQDSFDIFINNNLKVRPTDHVLNKYLKWAKKELKNELRSHK